MAESIPIIETERYSTKDRLLINAAELLGPWLIRILGLLCRYDVIGEVNILRAKDEGKGVILAVWHGRMLLPIYHMRKRGIVPLISLHRDGEIITRIAHKLGYAARRGSPKEGGLEGFKAMLKDLRAGKIVAMFPDGPTGPRHSLHDGLLHLARISGAPIVPLSFAADPSWRARSWDRFMIMKPFSRGRVIIHPGFSIPRKIESTETDSYREQIRQVLISIEKECNQHLGIVD